MRNLNLDEQIKLAEEACKNVDYNSNISIMDKLKAYSHLKNLLFIKLENLIKYDERNYK